MRRTLISLLLLAGFSFITPPASAISVDTVFVGDVGNANDPATGDLFGGVNYAYNIAKTEVTVAQYMAFLNAVAATDTYQLYNPSMTTDMLVAGISQSGVSGSYTYAVIGFPNHPVTYVSWGDAARFCNWLHNGQPTGAQLASTTEDGAYLMNGATTTPALQSITRKPGATSFVPSENEWYKAAYYQPAAQGGDSDDYWAYPTRSNEEPHSDQPSGLPSFETNVANYFRDDSAANGFDDGFAVTERRILDNIIGPENYLTDVGAYVHATSPYGTYDQGGNVAEWTEGLTNRCLRGGDWYFDSSTFSLNSSARVIIMPDENPFVGFRVATIPEPCSATLAIIAVAVMSWRKKQLNRLRTNDVRALSTIHRAPL